MTTFSNPHERIEKLMSALEKCIDTFDDLERVLRLIGKPIMADACAVAADASRSALQNSEKSDG